MRYIRVKDDANRDQLTQAITTLRQKQRAATNSEVVTALQADVDELLDMWQTADG